MSQKSEILRVLQLGHQITPLSALRQFKCMRLAARIKDLRDDGFNIAMNWSVGEKRYAVYTLLMGDG